VREPLPAISGPSFLGLNNPAPTGRQGGLGIDPGPAPSSRNLDYLLEDDEEPKRGGAGKFVLIFLALALAVGLGYLRWKNQGFGWLSLSSSSNKPAAAVPDSTGTDSGTTAPSVPLATSTQNAPPSATPPATGTPSQPPANSPSSAAKSAVSPAAGSPSPKTAAVGPEDASAAQTQGPPVTQPPAAKDKNTDTATKDSDASDTDNTDNKDDSDALPAATAKPKPAPAETVTKPQPKSVKVDPVSEAQKYLYGKGVTQDCSRGLRILKPLADQANPKAMIEMGALYSAGLCTPHDLPTAYHWFAMALHKEPDNTSVQDDLQKLWGEMTQPERQLAIKLSQ
jgi:hypothetical protein